MTDFKLGKLPARPDAVTFKLASYVDLKAILPTIPTKVGHSSLLPANVGMFANDQFGDCVWAGAAHETILWNLMQGHAIEFNDRAVLSDYTAVTGFNPDDPDTDQGTDMQAAASYRRKVGVVDAQGVRHKIDAYLALEAGNIDQLRAAIYLFGAVGIGVNFPGFWMDQFNHGKEWTYRVNPKMEGGHYIPGIASVSPKGALTIETWGAKQKMSVKSYQHYNDESIAYISLEALNASGKSLEGFAVEDLRRDLAALPKV
jgi:hypothetical protein